MFSSGCLQYWVNTFHVIMGKLKVRDCGMVSFRINLYVIFFHGKSRDQWVHIWLLQRWVWSWCWLLWALSHRQTSLSCSAQHPHPLHLAAVSGFLSLHCYLLRKQKFRKQTQRRCYCFKLFLWSLLLCFVPRLLLHSFNNLYDVILCPA